MTVYISTDRRKPSVQTYIAVRAGSAEDPANSTGLAHYLEHMLFKGTSRLGTIDFAQEKPHLDNIAALYASKRGGRDKVTAYQPGMEAEPTRQRGPRARERSGEQPALKRP